MRLQLQAQDRAVRLLKAIRPELDAGYAGAWYDDQRRGLVVAVSNADAERMVRSFGATAKRVSLSERQLQDVRDRLTVELAAAQASHSVRATRIDPLSNQVIVEANPEHAERLSQILSGMGTDADNFVVVPSRHEIVHLTTAYNGVGYGTPPFPEACSVGFAVQHPSGLQGFLTAAHCGLAGQTVTINNSLAGAFYASSRPVQAYVDPDGTFVFDNPDQAWVSLSIGFVSSPFLNPAWDHRTVWSHEEAIIGTWVCRYGRRTWGPHCGKVVFTSVRFSLGVFDGHPLIIPDAVQVNACGGPSDSGGPLIRPSLAKACLQPSCPLLAHAIGLLSGGTAPPPTISPTNCPTTLTTFTYYTKVSDALQLFNLTLK